MSKQPGATFELATESSVKRFLALNRDRLRRVYDSLTGRQRDFLDALPLLFHINHPLLPGYVAKDTVFGIAQYSPSQASVRATRQLCRSFDYDRRSAPRFAIQGLYMMGSPGTIAYSRTSDLDMWLMHAPGIDSAALGQLGEKARKIESFAATIGLEVHFFVFDAERFRSGENLSLSDESSGSSQHYLLLDEFYRSSLLVAGRPPLWWRVPARYDGDYEGYVAAAEARRLIDRDDYIDFGGLPSIPADEFFGAAVWQLYKGIHSPYKSVLKLLLMEAYAAEYPDITLLSTRFKRNVESDQVDLNALDPYILMYSKVEEYLSASKDVGRLEVLRRSFYIKANVAVHVRESPPHDDWRIEVMADLVRTWGWITAQVTRLNQRDEWGLPVAIEERRDLTNTFKRSYAVLSEFAKQHASDSKITKHDLHILGRKLYAAFERKPSKIEVVTRGICSNPVEPSLSLHEIAIDNDKFVWLVFPGSVTPADAASRKPIKRSGSAAEIIFWCQQNRLANDATTWHVFTAKSKLNAVEIKRINQTLGRTLVGSSDEPHFDPANRRQIARLVILVNVGVDPFSGPLPGGDILTSDRNDPFAFGGREINLVHTIDLLFVTSWDEAFAFRYEGPRAVLEALAECLQWMVAERNDVDLPTIETRCLHAENATIIGARVASLFEDTLKEMLEKWRVKTPHVVMQCEDEIHHLKLSSGRPVLESYTSQALLLRALGSSDDGSEQSVRFDRSCTRAGLLPEIYRRNRGGCIQIFAHRRGSRADVYMLEERGILLMHRQECESMAALLEHYRRFLDSALKRCDHGLDDGSVIETETIEVITTTPSIQFKTYPADLGQAHDYLPLHVLADADSNNHQQFTIYVGEREFSTWEHGGSLFVEVAEFVLRQRAAAEIYPIYITDLDLSTRFRQLIGVGALRAHDLLSYKKRIEHQLTRAMHNNAELTTASPDLAS